MSRLRARALQADRGEVEAHLPLHLLWPTGETQTSLNLLCKMGMILPSMSGVRAPQSVLETEGLPALNFPTPRSACDGPT